LRFTVGWERIPPGRSSCLDNDLRSAIATLAQKELQVRADSYFVAAAAAPLVAFSIRAATSLGCESMAR
jgi:hypothetical protein